MIQDESHAKIVTDAFVSVKFSFENSNTLKIEHSLLISSIAIFQYGWGSHIHHRSNDLADKPRSYDSWSICKQTTKFFIPEKLVDLNVNSPIFIQIKWMFIVKSNSTLLQFFQNNFRNNYSFVNEPLLERDNHNIWLSRC